MARKTIIITENQLGEICGSNTAYLDNSSDYAEDGTIRVRTDGAVTDAGGEKTYSEPTTTDDYADELAPETLFALLFRNGGHGLWGHWGTGLRTPELDGFDMEFDDDEEGDEYIIDDDDTLKKYFSDEDLKYLFESNSELEGRSWMLDLGNDGLKKKYSYTNMTTKASELKRKLGELVKQNAPEGMIRRVKSAYAAICRVLNRETGAIEGRKRTKKNLGFNNQYQKEGGTKDAGNGKAKSKKIEDPNVGTGFISYYA